MARQETILTVFVASPSDVVKERDQVVSVIEELNTLFRKQLGLRLEVLRWETDAVPGMGSDPQTLVNESIGDDYDMFVGILWARFGSPTPRAGSGTEEEFNRAYQRFIENPKAVRIMLYFKEAPISPSIIDVDQLRAVLAFRERVGEHGLYATFSDENEFSTLLRLHLGKVVQEWESKHNDVSSPPETAESFNKAVVIVDETSLETEADVGLLDLFDAAEEHMARATEVLVRIMTATEEFNRRIRERTVEMQITAASNPDRSELKRVTARAAQDFTFYARSIESETPLFAQEYRNAFDAVAQSAPLHLDFPEGRETLQNTLVQLQELIPKMETAVSSAREFRDTNARLPRISTVFNRAKRGAIEAQDRLILEMDTALNLARETEKMIRNALSQGEKITAVRLRMCRVRVSCSQAVS